MAAAIPPFQFQMSQRLKTMKQLSPLGFEMEMQGVF
jgi:hypothetical protein